MLLSLRKAILLFTFNLTLFFILMIGIQNSSQRSKVYVLNYETINLPVSFIVGSSFITGSFIGLLVPLGSFFKKNS